MAETLPVSQLQYLTNPIVIVACILVAPYQIDRQTSHQPPCHRPPPPKTSESKQARFEICPCAKHGTLILRDEEMVEVFSQESLPPLFTHLLRLGKLRNTDIPNILEQVRDSKLPRTTDFDVVAKFLAGKITQAIITKYQERRACKLN